MKIFTYENVKLDENSQFSWEKLNESDYVRSTLLQLWELMGDDFQNYLFFIFSNNDSGRIPSSIDHKTNKKKVLIYLSDERGSDPSKYAPHYFIIFKSYIGHGNFASKVFPFPLGCVNKVPSFNVKPTNQRKYNLFFRGNLNVNRLDFYRAVSRLSFILPSKRLISHPLYRRFLLWIRSDFSRLYPDSIIIFNSKFKEGFSVYKYGQVLAESKIVLSPNGFTSPECFRLYEAMRAGCVVIAEKLPDVVFYKDSPIIQVANWKVGLKTANELLKDSEQLSMLQEKTIEWWNTVFSEKATASYMLEKIKTVTS
nr:hypothetical protein [Cytophagales bacterium]